MGRRQSGADERAAQSPRVGNPAIPARNNARWSAPNRVSQSAGERLIGAAVRGRLRIELRAHRQGPDSLRWHPSALDTGIPAAAARAPGRHREDGLATWAPAPARSTPGPPPPVCRRGPELAAGPPDIARRCAGRVVRAAPGRPRSPLSWVLPRPGCERRGSCPKSSSTGRSSAATEVACACSASRVATRRSRSRSPRAWSSVHAA